MRSRRLTRNVYLELTFAIFLVAVLFYSLYWSYASWLVIRSGGFGAAEGQRTVWVDARLGNLLASMLSTAVLSSLILDLYLFVLVRLVVKLAGWVWLVPFKMARGSWESIEMREAEKAVVVGIVTEMLSDTAEQMNLALDMFRTTTNQRFTELETRLSLAEESLKTLSSNMTKAARKLQKHETRLVALEPEVIPPKTPEQLLAEEQAKAAALQAQLAEMQQMMNELKRQQQKQLAPVMEQAVAAPVAAV